MSGQFNRACNGGPRTPSRGPTIAVLALWLWSIQSTAAPLAPGTPAYVPKADQSEFGYQYNSCTVTTTEAIYNEERGEVCGVESRTPYADSSCPVAQYKSCRDESHGVAYWQDVTGTPGNYPTRRVDGYGSVDGCLEKGRAWIPTANAGQVRGIKPPGAGLRFHLISVNWEGTDTRDPVFNNRVRAYHTCTYTYGIERAQYAARRSSACGAETHQSCRTRTVYNACRHSSFGIEGYKEETGTNRACGFRVERGQVALLYNGQLLAKPLEGGGFSIVNVRERVQGDCAKVSNVIERHRCVRVNRAALDAVIPDGTAYAQALIDTLAKVIDKAADQVMLQALSSGDMRLQFDRMFDTYYDTKFTGSREESKFLEDVKEAVPRIPDEVYFPLTIRLATQALTAPALTDHDESSGVYYRPLYRLISNAALERRRVPFKTVSDLLVLLRAADPKASPRMRGQIFILNEYLTRLTSAYVDRRAYDIALLQSDAAKLQDNAASLNAAIATVMARVREMKLRPEVETSAIQQLQGVTAAAQLQTTLRDLIQAARSDVTSTIASTAGYIQDSAAADKLLRANMADVHLMRGNVNHAVLQIRESGVAFKQVSRVEDKGSHLNSSFTMLRENFASTVKRSLAQSRSVLEKLRSGSELTLEMLGIDAGQTQVPLGLLDALMQANVAVGDNLDGIRLQLINQIAANVVEPLQQANSQLAQ